MHDTASNTGDMPGSSLAALLDASPASREQSVRAMFAAIAPRYDLLNALLSFNRHHAWRRAAVRFARISPGQVCLDMCSGTADLALEAAHATGPSGAVLGMDFCLPMLAAARRKPQFRQNANIVFSTANACAIPCHSGLFDAVTIGFGIRNVTRIDTCLLELYRVLKPGGRLVILEFARPERGWTRPIVDFYLFRLLPRVGAIFSRRDAYRYLPESMKRFLTRAELRDRMELSGFTNVTWHDMHLGTVCIHVGVRPDGGAS
ncbi:MAG: bifunctional demethylmenaquinone methyltransferase/2-methoxy-6-polyprenyl-1,4-benzoquinol methylase UbiE [Armatimonadetes bacterium]|nr:bifunctional demethylmenaquinone methyltransferase/2-methoxy-6-polyprenyl-1,4-benzoquinol methylase UbiE [Armatimonadota bacterium]MDE2207966.1 bifunctional demethylmenaquinone methyltransferase/2-methoxy-6-polyprenyl-1,4-benzoquinol methylase UbiE [Armatimonadota bacterium]